MDSLIWAPGIRRGDGEEYLVYLLLNDPEPRRKVFLVVRGNPFMVGLWNMDQPFG